MIYNVHDYGAVGDGIHNDTTALQAAIDACYNNGGGQVVLSGGHTYRSGALKLNSYVELHLETGAVLKGSDSLEDYNLLHSSFSSPEKISTPTYENCEYTGQPFLHFLYAKDCEYVSITGNGKIDGNESIINRLYTISLSFVVNKPMPHGMYGSSPRIQCLRLGDVSCSVNIGLNDVLRARVDGGI